MPSALIFRRFAAPNRGWRVGGSKVYSKGSVIADCSLTILWPVSIDILIMAC
jgi:hypothetical protein